MQVKTGFVLAGLLAAASVASANAQPAGDNAPTGGNEPITFLGMTAFMSEAEVAAALTSRGYKCFVRDENSERLARLICSKRVGDNLRVPGAGAYGTVERRRSDRIIEVFCLAIADGLDEKEVGACQGHYEAGAHHPRRVVARLAAQGTLKRTHNRKRTGENSACFSTALGDSLCVRYDDHHEQTKIFMYGGS